MAKSWTMEYFDYEIICKYFYDVDTDCEGIDIYVDGERIGEFWGLVPPDGDDMQVVDQFEQDVKIWLEENYFKV